MTKCIKCYSYAINPEDYGREKGVDLDLCDVCYWRKRADEARIAVCKLTTEMTMALGCETLSPKQNAKQLGWDYLAKVL